MKKIVCEICGSQKLKKENGMFVCQECGTEYSLDEARNLLVDVDSSEPVSEKPAATRNGQAELRGQLVLWASLLKQIEDLDFYFDLSGMDTYKFWSVDNVKENVPSVGRRTYRCITTKQEFNTKGYSDWTYLFDKEIAGTLSYLAKREPEYIEKYEAYKKVLNDSDLILCRCYWLEEIEKLASNRFIFDELSKMDRTITGIRKTTELDDYLKGDYFLLVFRSTPNFEIIRPDFSNIDILAYANKLVSIAVRHGERVCIECIKQKWYGSQYWAPLDLGFDLNGLVEKCYRELERIEKGIDAFYEKEVTPIVEEGYSVISECISLSKKLEKEFNLPVKYRRLEHVLSMIELLDEGKASDWKELVNLYDTGNYRKEVLSDLSEISAKMDNLIASVNTTNGQLFSMGSAMKEIGFSLSSIAAQTHKISASASRFEKYSKITMLSSL